MCWCWQGFGILGFVCASCFGVGVIQAGLCPLLGEGERFPLCSLCHRVVFPQGDYFFSSQLGKSPTVSALQSSDSFLWCQGSRSLRSSAAATSSSPGHLPASLLLECTSAGGQASFLSGLLQLLHHAFSVFHGLQPSLLPKCALCMGSLSLLCSGAGPCTSQSHCASSWSIADPTMPLFSVRVTFLPDPHLSPANHQPCCCSGGLMLAHVHLL